VNFTPMELELCKAWAKEHAEDDDPLDVFHWKLLENGREKAERSARYHARTVAEIDVDMAPLSAKFYENVTAEPDGDPDVDF